MANTPVFLPRDSHGLRRLVGYSPWGHKKSDMTEATEATEYTVYQSHLLSMKHTSYRKERNIQERNNSFLKK